MKARFGTLALTLTTLGLAFVFSGCQSQSLAGSTDPHGTYSPEEAKAAAMSQLKSKPQPKGQHPSAPTASGN